ncbi:MAG: hypothetical protein FK731_15645 [Asgard group archaeon]|nr:hypothetical protein [Asgard group archaeon]
MQDQLIKCPECKGSKKIQSLGFVCYPCKKCGGTGVVVSFDVKEDESNPVLEDTGKEVTKKRGRPSKTAEAILNSVSSDEEK